MGAEQSWNRENRSGKEDEGYDASVKSCYYAVLDVPRDASPDEIKTAYRKKALELHPDRNYGDVEQATQQFAEVQSAYEVLSDAQERAWYDSHREAILNGGSTVAENHFKDNIRLTSADDVVTLIGRFSKKLPFTDTPNGFYGALRNTFATLAQEEQAACEWEGLQNVDYPDFGNANDSYESVVKKFYSIWLGFNTKKSYSWKAIYKYSEAPDRRIRRVMEKENKRLCDESIKEFNDAVRTLVAFARKRDPRYVANAQSEADRQKLLREAGAAQAARSRAANQAKLNAHFVPNWAKSEVIDEEDSLSGEELSEEEQYECVTCGKIFKSEKQYEMHEKSKKHIKAVYLQKKQMQRDNKTSNLDSGSADISDDTTYSKLSREEMVFHEEKEPEKLSPRQRAESVGSLVSDAVQSAAEASGSEIASNPDGVTDEYASRDEVEARLSELHICSDMEAGEGFDTKNDIDGQNSNSSKLDEEIHATGHGAAIHKTGKAKLKRVKRAARQEADDKEHPFTCAKCNEHFSSKTKLFNHLNELDHEWPVSKAHLNGKRY